MTSAQTNTDIVFFDHWLHANAASGAAIVCDGPDPLALALDMPMNAQGVKNHLEESRLRRVVSKHHLSTALKSALGEAGTERIKRFLSYQRNWDNEGAPPVSIESLEGLEKFVAAFSQFATTPSIFLSHVGQFVLGWEDASDQSVELEFTDRRTIEYWIERTDDEREVSAHEVSDLIRLICD